MLPSSSSQITGSNNKPSTACTVQQTKKKGLTAQPRCTCNCRGLCFQTLFYFTFWISGPMFILPSFKSFELICAHWAHILLTFFWGQLRKSKRIIQSLWDLSNDPEILISINYASILQISSLCAQNPPDLLILVFLLLRTSNVDSW